MFLVSEQLTTAVQIQTCIYYLIKLKSPYGEENLQKKSTKNIKSVKKCILSRSYDAIISCRYVFVKKAVHKWIWVKEGDP